jgi:hypothetical protein
MYVLKVILYKNAVRIMAYNNGSFVGSDEIRINWWQRSQARNIVDSFYLSRISDLYSKGVEWQLDEHTGIKWNFKTCCVE